MTTCIDPEAWVTQSEAARILGVTHQRIHQLCAKGTLASIRPWPGVALVAADDVAERRTVRGES